MSEEELRTLEALGDLITKTRPTVTALDIAEFQGLGTSEYESKALFSLIDLESKRLVRRSYSGGHYSPNWMLTASGWRKYQEYF